MGELAVDKIRQLEEILLPPVSPYLHPQGLSTDSSISPSTAAPVSFTLTKPKLKGPLELQLIQTHNEVTGISKRAMKASAKQIDRRNMEFQEITNRHLDALTQSAQASQTEKSWSHLQQLGALVLGVANIGVGTYLFVQDNGSDTAAWLLMSAGIAALTGAALDKWLHDESGTQSNLSIAAPIILGMVSLALSMAATRYTADIPEVKNLLDTLQTAMSGLLALGKPYLEFIKTRADLKLLGVQKDLFLKEESIKGLFQMIETLLKEFDRITRVIKKTTRYTINQNIPA